MKLTEIKKDIFKVQADAYAHCISADFALGAGIAVPFKKKFKLDFSNCPAKWPCCIYQNNVFNLVTKERYFHKPSYDSLTISLLDMKSVIVRNNIKTVAMPTIGCGLDRLSWPKVKEIIKVIFENIDDLEITVCFYNKRNWR